jgi:hypothetical protein
MRKMDELEVVIRHKNDRFTAGIPQLGLFAKADNINAALAALDVKKNAYLADLEEAGELDTLEIEDRLTPTRRGTQGSSPGGIGQFILKAGIVVCCVVVAVVSSSVLIVSKAEQSFENAVKSAKSIKIGGAEFWSHVEDELDRMARPGSDLPEAKKQKLLADIHAISAKWHPFVAEIQSTLADPKNVTPSIGTSTKK